MAQLKKEKGSLLRFSCLLLTHQRKFKIKREREREQELSEALFIFKGFKRFKRFKGDIKIWLQGPLFHNKPEVVPRFASLFIDD